MHLREQCGTECRCDHHAPPCVSDCLGIGCVPCWAHRDGSQITVPGGLLSMLGDPSRSAHESWHPTTIDAPRRMKTHRVRILNFYSQGWLTGMAGSSSAIGLRRRRTGKANASIRLRPAKADRSRGPMRGYASSIGAAPYRLQSPPWRAFHCGEIIGQAPSRSSGFPAPQREFFVDLRIRHIRAIPTHPSAPQHDIRVNR